MNNSNLSIKKKYNIIFLISLSVISFSGLMILIWLLFGNSPDDLNLKRPTPYLLLPIYLVVRLIFLKIEVNRNINIDKTEEIMKLLLFIYFLTIISMKFFPLDGDKFIADLLSINFLSFNALFSTKAIIKTFVVNLILFIPLGLLVPMFMNKFKSISNCIVLSLIVAISIHALQIVLHFIGLYVVDIISLDLILINIIGALIGYKLYNLMINYNLKKSLSLIK